MRQAACERCRQAFPMGETFDIHSHVYCRACAEQFIQERGGQIDKDEVSLQLDPTVCVECKRDFGQEEVPKLAGVPVCDECGERYRNRPYPAWVKAGFAVLVLLTVFSFARYWRFMAGHFEARGGMRAFEQGDIEESSRLFTAAAENVPESQELQAMADLLKGALLFKQDKPAEALPLLQKARKPGPVGGLADLLILQCEMSLAFDAKDYDKFLEKSTALYDKMGRDSFAGCSMMASAYACKFAVSGDEKFRKQALDFVQRAGKARDKDEEKFGTLQQRIAHRLETRKIIDSKEFKKRFPDGWKSGAAESAEEARP